MISISLKVCTRIYISFKTEFLYSPNYCIWICDYFVLWYRLHFTVIGCDVQNRFVRKLVIRSYTYFMYVSSFYFVSILVSFRSCSGPYCKTVFCICYPVEISILLIYYRRLSLSLSVCVCVYCQTPPRPMDGITLYLEKR